MQKSTRRPGHWTYGDWEPEDYKKLSDSYKGVWDDANKKEDKMDNKDTNALYEFKIFNRTVGEKSVTVETIKYGTYLATNSQNQAVMEEKGTGTIYAVDPDTVKEVLPHTIGIKFFGGTGQVYHYLAEKDKFEVGDLFLFENNNGLSFVRVQAVNTESKKATKEFKPLSKVITEKC